MSDRRSNEELVRAVGVIHHLDCPPPDLDQDVFASGCEEQPRAAALAELARRLEAAEAARDRALDLLRGFLHDADHGDLPSEGLRDMTRAAVLDAARRAAEGNTP